MKICFQYNSQVLNVADHSGVMGPEPVGVELGDGDGRQDSDGGNHDQ